MQLIKNMGGGQHTVAHTDIDLHSYYIHIWMEKGQDT